MKYRYINRHDQHPAVFYLRSLFWPDSCALLTSINRRVGHRVGGERMSLSAPFIQLRSQRPHLAFRLSYSEVTVELTMSDPNEQLQPVTSALPDICSSPADSKKAKLLQVENGDPPKEDADGSPVLSAIPLPSDEVEAEANEEWFHLRMSWSGKLYELKVGANDMFVPNPPCFNTPFVLADLEPGSSTSVPTSRA